MTAAELLRAAAGIYAAAPSHAPLGTMPERGTYCIAYALGQATRQSGGWKVARVAVEALEHVADAPLISWNAENTTEAVLAAVDTAATLCEGRQR